ncbi:CRISPR-associated helicase Cas3' [Terrisporobacter sp.]
MKEKIMAKSETTNQHKETLVEHMESLLFVLSKISKKIDFNYFNYIDEKIIDKVIIKFEELLKQSCILHDLGKINIKMQDRLKGEDIKCIRHNIITGTFLKAIFECLNTPQDVQLIMYKELLLHHGSYNQYLGINRASVEEAVYFDIKEGILDSDKFDIEEIEKYINDKLNINIKFNEDILDYDFMDKFNGDFQGVKEYYYLYIMLKGFLNLIDHLASTQIKDFEYYLPYKSDEVDEFLIKCIKKKNDLKDIEFNKMQKNIGKLHNQNVLTQAFTGSGKTAADYRWYSKRKIFLVPNKISAESFYNDAVEILGVDNVGLLHGDISLYVNNENKDEHEGMEISLKDKELSRNFAKPYIIATIDQLLLAMFKYPGYEKIFASIYNSNITVDEVHLLTPRMYLILLYFIQFSNKYLNSNFHLMTATLPNVYKEKLNELEIEFIESNKDEDIEENKKIKLDILKNNEKDILKLVQDGIKEEHKILIIKNTINESINMYKFLEKNMKDNNIKINLLHSRFKFEDKSKKYVEILNQKGDIWISTQGVEISLDLDFPIIISDNAPLESIIQRMGRCNRHNTLEYGQFYVLDEDKSDVYDHKLKKITLKEIKKQKNKVLSMKDRKILLDKYYETKEAENYFKKEFEEADRILKNVYGIKENNLNGENIIFNYEPYLNIVDNKREASKLFRGNTTNIKVILEEDFKQLSVSKHSFKEYQLKSLQISSGIYYYLKDKNGLFTKEGYIVVRDGYYKYSYERGLEIK